LEFRAWRAPRGTAVPGVDAAEGVGVRDEAVATAAAVEVGGGGGGGSVYIGDKA